MPLVPGSTDRLHGADHARSVAVRARLPGAAEGGRRRRRARACGWSTTPADIEDAYGLASSEALASFGDGGMYLEKAVLEPAPRRDAGAGRRRGRRARPGRARLLGAAPPPEADRGGAVAGARRGDARADGRGGDARVHRLRLPQRRHGRVPARHRRPLLLHRDEHPPAGRAPGLGARDRRRPGLPAAAARRRRAAARDRPAPLRGHAIEFRINCEDPAPRLPPGGRHGHRPAAAARARACASTPTPTRATGCRRSTTRCSPS